MASFLKKIRNSRAYYYLSLAPRGPQNWGHPKSNDSPTILSNLGFQVLPQNTGMFFPESAGERYNGDFHF